MLGRSLLFAFFAFTSELTPTTASQQSSGSPDSDSELGNHNQFSNIRRVNIGDACVYDSDSKNSCPIAMCLPEPEGCTYIDKYVVSGDGECCPSMCYAVDSDGNECNFDDNDPNPSIEGDLCTADDEQKNAFGCPVAKCMAPPEGCSYIFDHYVTNGEGDCCASMCYAVDSDGAKCAVINVENEIDITDPGNEGALCTADDEQKNAFGCPVATCMGPPEGCSYIFDHYVTNGEGDCCASMCYAVDLDGAKCDVINVENEIDITDPGNEGALCTADDEQKNAFGCPVATCMAPPDGCSYIFDHYVMNGEGDCCASMCYAVDSSGAKCAVLNIENEIDTTDSSMRLEAAIEGDLCTADDEQKNTFGCPVARCMAPLEGWSYIFDHYVINSQGDCCASLCYAVHSDGEARFFEITSSGQETSSGQAIFLWPSLANAIICSIIIIKSMV